MEKIKQLPKLDLHCHLDGSLSLKTIRQLLPAEQLPKEDATLLSMLQVSEDCSSLKEYLEKFEIPLNCLQTEEGLRKGAFQLIEQVSKENIKYIEVRFAPMLSTQRQLSCKKVIESVLTGLKEGEKYYKVHASVIVCAMRHHSFEQNTTMLNSAREFFKEGVCALDLAGDESSYPTMQFRELFYHAKKLEMPFTIHSGECGSIENIKEAIDLGAKRLGHGIALQKSESLRELCKEKRIGIELCPTSNLQTKAVKNWKNYPLNQFLENGLLVTINTDNRTVSNTSITKELELVYYSLNSNIEVIETLLKNAIELSFADDSIKQELWSQL